METKLTLYTILFLFCLFVLSCKERPLYSPELEHAPKIMNEYATHPSDSAISIASHYFYKQHDSKHKSEAWYYMENQRLHERIVSGTGIVISIILLVCVVSLHWKYRRKQEMLLHNETLKVQHEKELRLQSEVQLKLNTHEIILLKNNYAEFKEHLFKQTGFAERINAILIDSQKGDCLITPFTKGEFPKLIYALNIIYNDFVLRLQKEYPGLKEHDLKICCLLKAGAKTKSISILINMTPNAVSKKKNQIAQKMNLDLSAEALDRFLQQY